jgi:hypothetical protein
VQLEISPYERPEIRSKIAVFPRKNATILLQGYRVIINQSLIPRSQIVMLSERVYSGEDVTLQDLVDLGIKLPRLPIVSLKNGPSNIVARISGNLIAWSDIEKRLKCDLAPEEIQACSK